MNTNPTPENINDNGSIMRLSSVMAALAFKGDEC